MADVSPQHRVLLNHWRMELFVGTPRALAAIKHFEGCPGVAPDMSVEKGHEIAKEVRHQLLHHLRYLSNATIHIDPSNASGEKHHHIHEHVHDNESSHSH